MDTQSLLRRSQSPGFTLRHNCNQMVQTMRVEGVGGCQRKELKKTIPLADACPRNECIFYSRALNMPVKSLRIESLPTFSLPVVFLCVSCLFSCPLFTQHFPSLHSKMIDKLEAMGGEYYYPPPHSFWTESRTVITNSDPTEKIQIMFMPRLNGVTNHSK